MIFGGFERYEARAHLSDFAQSIDFGNYTMICADKHQHTWFDLSQTETKAWKQIRFQITVFSYSNEIFTNSKAVVDDYYRLKKMY